MPFIVQRLARAWSRLQADRRGNVLMIFAFALVPITLSTGMTIDYARAARLQTRLNAVTDAAALAGVTPTMLVKTREEARDAIFQNFYAQAGVSQCQVTANRIIFSACSYTSSSNGSTYRYSDGTLSVVIKDSSTASLSRVVTLSYAAKSGNIFGNILGSSSIEIAGTTITKGSQSPNIDFYMMLDVSSSMALPTTTAGITAMKNLNNNCAFACHMTNPTRYTDDHTGDTKAYDNAGNQIDFYALAHKNGIVLRIDSGKTAIQDTIDRAIATMQVNKANYRFGVSTFSRAANFTRVASVTDTLAKARTAAGNAETVSVTYKANDWDRWTEYDRSILAAGALMPLASGNGTDQFGDTPQSILFIVTDGMRDEELFGRQMGPILQAQCDLIKARRNTRIAVLYTTYDPASIAGDGWSQDNVAWRLPSIAPALQSCASPNLFFEVSTDQSISDAMRQLFDMATSSARITQ